MPESCLRFDNYLEKPYNWSPIFPMLTEIKRLKVYFVIAALAVSSAGVSHAQVDQAIRAQVTKEGGAIASWYKKRGYVPVWSGPRLGGLAEFIKGMDAHGLKPELFQFEKWDSYWRNPDQSPDTRASIDIGTTKMALFAIQSLAYGFANPTEFHPKWKELNRTPTAYDFLNAAIDKESPDRLGQYLLSKVPPEDERYKDMIKSLARFRKIDSFGGWRNLAATAAPAGPGSSYPQISLLRSRLQAEGDLPPSAGKFRGKTIDKQMGEAIKSFQFRHGIDPDGYIGKGTLEELNISVADRVKTLIINIDRLRWMPRTYEQADHIEVNIAEGALRVYDGNRRVTTMPVIVGVKGQHQTPVFHGDMKYLVFRPYWNVPLSIAKSEIAPKALADPTYMDTHHYEIYTRKGILPSTEANLNKAASGRLNIRQRGGPDNSLGLVKFIFPNDSSVYLHDTDRHELFDATNRDFSHGCVRVARPDELADIVLRRNGGWSIEDIRAAMKDESHPDRKEDLKRSMPVFLIYWTSTIMGDGRIRFDQDIYGHDATMFQKFLIP